MGIIILKPQKRDSYVTLNSQGRLFFSVGAIDELELTPKKGVLMAQDDEGNLLLKVAERDTFYDFQI